VRRNQNELDFNQQLEIAIEESRNPRPLGLDIPPEIPHRLLRPPSLEEEVSTLHDVETRMAHILLLFHCLEACFTYNATHMVCVAFSTLYLSLILHI